jgi:hypothetical protein
VLLNNKTKDAATIANDDALKRLCESCKSTADELLAALDKVKVNGKQDRRKSIRKALRSVWSKERICELVGRLEKFREKLNLHVIVDLRCVGILLVITMLTVRVVQGASLTACVGSFRSRYKLLTIITNP